MSCFGSINRVQKYENYYNINDVETTEIDLYHEPVDLHSLITFCRRCLQTTDYNISDGYDESMTQNEQVRYAIQEIFFGNFMNPTVKRIIVNLYTGGESKTTSTTTSMVSSSNFVNASSNTLHKFFTFIQRQKLFLEASTSVSASPVSQTSSPPTSVVPSGKNIRSKKLFVLVPELSLQSNTNLLTDDSPLKSPTLTDVTLKSTSSSTSSLSSSLSTSKNKSSVFSFFGVSNKIVPVKTQTLSQSTDEDLYDIDNINNKTENTCTNTNVNKNTSPYMDKGRFAHPASHIDYIYLLVVYKFSPPQTKHQILKKIYNCVVYTNTFRRFLYFSYFGITTDLEELITENVWKKLTPLQIYKLTTIISERLQYVFTSSEIDNTKNVLGFKVRLLYKCCIQYTHMNINDVFKLHQYRLLLCRSETDNYVMASLNTVRRRNFDEYTSSIMQRLDRLPTAFCVSFLLKCVCFECDYFSGVDKILTKITSTFHLAPESRNEYDERVKLVKKMKLEITPEIKEYIQKYSTFT